MLTSSSIAQLFVIFDIFATIVTTQAFSGDTENYSTLALQLRTFVFNVYDWFDFIDIQTQLNSKAKLFVRRHIFLATAPVYNLYFTVGDSEQDKHNQRLYLSDLRTKRQELQHIHSRFQVSGAYLDVLRTVHLDYDRKSNVRIIDAYHTFMMIAVLAYLFIGMPIKYTFSTSVLTAALLSGTIGTFISLKFLIKRFLKNPFHRKRPFHVANHDEWINDLHTRSETEVVMRIKGLDDVLEPTSAPKTSAPKSSAKEREDEEWPYTLLKPLTETVVPVILPKIPAATLTQRFVSGRYAAASGI
jgi:hypothetical protein